MACSCENNKAKVNALPPTKENLVAFGKNLLLGTVGYVAGGYLRQKLEFLKDKPMISGGVKLGTSAALYLGLGDRYAESMPAAVGMGISGLYDLAEAGDGDDAEKPFSKHFRGGIAGIGEIDYTPYRTYKGIASPSHEYELEAEPQRMVLEE